VAAGVVDEIATGPDQRPDAAPVPTGRFGPPMPSDRLVGWLGPLAVTLLAGYLRFADLTSPSGRMFDEIYYAKDAYSLLQFGVETDKNGPGFVAHPPLGKWAIGAGQALFGNTEFGWRVSAAVAGTLAVLILARTARRLTRSTLLGCLAGLLLALDALEFVQSRIAMLDIFLMVWVLAAFACLVVDRDAGRDRLARATAGSARAPSGFGPHLGVRWWRVAAGFCLGAACATKWSGIYYIPAFAVLAYLWDAGARRRLGVRRPYAAAASRDLPAVLLSFVGLAALVYTVSWTGWFVGDRYAYGHDTYVQRGQGSVSHAVAVLRGWIHYQRQILSFHTGLEAKHPYQSHPLGWLLLARPVSYFYTSPKLGQEGCRAVGGCSREVLAIGTPAIWWASIGGLLACLWRWVSRRDWRAGAVLLGVAMSIVVWIPDDLHRRTMFLFYALPAVPFLCLALTLSAGWTLGSASATLQRRRIGTVAIGAYVVLVVLNFFYLYPLLTGHVLPYQDWYSRMWFSSWI
jgi:dolichyl-phosphate-mannose-protein mannosyltransferase